MSCPSSSSSWLSEPSECVKLVKSRSLTVLEVVQSLNSDLTNEDITKRKSAVKCLVVLTLADELQHDVEVESAWPHLFAFLVSKLKESVVVASEAVVGVVHLVLSAPSIDHASKMDAMRSIMDEMTVQALTVDQRLKIFEALVNVVDKEKEGSHKLDETFVLALAKSVEGETHPKCLYIIFSLWAKLMGNKFDYNDLAIEEIFEALACYFPIDYKPRNNEKNDNAVTVDQLKSSLHRAITMSPKFVDSAIALFLEKLTSDVEEAKVDALQCLQMALPKYSSLRLEAHVEDLWNCLKQEVMGIRSASSTSEPLRAEINSRCFKVLGVSTATLCKSSSSADAWLNLAWRDLKPFLRFVESGLMETAVDILASIFSTEVASQRLLSESVDILVESGRKHEEEEGSSRFLNMINKLLSSTSEILQIEKDVEKRLRDFCSECCFHPKEEETRVAGIKVALTAQKCFQNNEEWKKLALSCFHAASADGQFLKDNSTMIDLIITMPEEQVVGWLKSQVLPITQNTSGQLSTLLVELCKRILAIANETTSHLTIFNLIYEEFLSNRIIKAIEAINDVLVDNAIRLRSLEKLITADHDIRVEENGLHSPLVTLLPKISRTLSANDSESLALMKNLLKPSDVMKRDDLKSIVLALERQFLQQLPGIVDFSNPSLDSDDSYQLLRSSVMSKTQRDIDYSDYLNRVFSAQDFGIAKWPLKSLVRSSNPFLTKGLKLLVDLTMKSESNAEMIEQLLEEDEFLSPDNHHFVLPFFKQRFFQLTVPLLRAQLEMENKRAISTLLALLPFVPMETVTQSETITTLLPTLARRALVNEKEEASVGLALVPILKDVDVDLSNELSVPFLLRIAVQGNMKERIEALELLRKLSKTCADRMVRRRVTDDLVATLDDKKRLVRSAAVAARNTWFLDQ